MEMADVNTGWSPVASMTDWASTWLHDKPSQPNPNTARGSKRRPAKISEGPTHPESRNFLGNMPRKWPIESRIFALDNDTNLRAHLEKSAKMGLFAHSEISAG
jgi:hypothetical protein